MDDCHRLNRLEDILPRYGLHIARGTQCDWMAACAMLARPLYRLIVTLVLRSKVLGTDGTTVPVRDDGLDRTRTAYFWAYVGDHDHPYICYDFTTSHARDGPQRFSWDFPQSRFGEAITYSLSQWEPLCLFTEDPDIPIDDNRTEHTLRQQVLGRINWLFRRTTIPSPLARSVNGRAFFMPAGLECHHPPPSSVALPPARIPGLLRTDTIIPCRR